MPRHNRGQSSATSFLLEVGSGRPSPTSISQATTSPVSHSCSGGALASAAGPPAPSIPEHAAAVAEEEREGVKTSDLDLT